MKKAPQTPVAEGTSMNAANGNHGHTATATPPEELAAILGALQTMRDGDFSVRLPVAWIGIEGKIADAFNEIISANQQMASELKRVGLAVGKEGKTRERARFHQARGSWGEMEISVNT